MSKETVRRLITHNFQLAQCAPTSLTAILHAEPEKLTLEALHENTFSLDEITAITSLELLRYGIRTFARSMKGNRQPSSFFRETVHKLKHGKRLGAFMGGYMLTKSVEGIDHLIAITAYHEGIRPKFTVCNTNPHGLNKIYKREPIEWFDRNIHPDDGIYKNRAVALIGIPINPTNPDEIEKALNKQQELIAFREAMLERKYSR